MTPEELTEKLKEEQGDNLLSVILYGSAVRGDGTRYYSDVNILIVLKDTRFPLVKSLSSVFRRWAKGGHPFPLLFSEKSLRDSADVFPIEFMDIQESHRCLYGEDPFINLTVSKENLRHQIEFELRGKYLLLRQKYFEAGGKPGPLRELMAKSLSSFSALFKGVVRLSGQTQPKRRQEIWTALEKLVPIDRDAFDTVLLIREGAKGAGSVDMGDLFVRFLTSIEAVVNFVNDFK